MTNKLFQERILFEVNRNRKILLTWGIANILLIINGLIFLYANILSHNNFCLWLGVISFIIGFSLLYVIIKDFSRPLILIYEAGIWCDITILGKGIFIPYSDILSVKSEEIIVYLERGHPYIKCLMIELSEKAALLLPKILKIVYRKKGNKIYFTANSFSQPIDSIIGKILDAKRVYK